MFDVGGGELILILLAILLLFGPKKIPELSQMLGKGIREFRKAQSQLQSQLNDIKSEMNIDGINIGNINIDNNNIDAERTIKDGTSTANVISTPENIVPAKSKEMPRNENNIKTPKE